MRITQPLTKRPVATIAAIATTEEEEVVATIAVATVTIATATDVTIATMM